MLDSNDFDKIPNEVYKEIYQEAKDKFDEVKSQSATITSRSLTIILSTLGLSAWAVNTFSFNTILGALIACIYLLLLGFNCFSLGTLFFSRSMPVKGTMPEAIYGSDGKSLLNEQFIDRIDKVFYFQQINRYQKKILKANDENIKRGIPLKRATVNTIIMVLLVLLTFALKQGDLL